MSVAGHLANLVIQEETSIWVSPRHTSGPRFSQLVHGHGHLCEVFYPKVTDPLTVAQLCVPLQRQVLLEHIRAVLCILASLRVGDFLPLCRLAMALEVPATCHL